MCTLLAYILRITVYESPHCFPQMTDPRVLQWYLYMKVRNRLKVVVGNGSITKLTSLAKCN